MCVHVGHMYFGPYTVYYFIHTNSIRILSMTVHLFSQAFRYMSHKFHGRGSGKKKTEKRMKKLQEEHVSASSVRCMHAPTDLLVEMLSIDGERSDPTA